MIGEIGGSRISASRALYIKLGEGNCWARLALDSGTLRFGFRDFPHNEALTAVENNNFAIAKSFYENELSVNPGTATRYSNELREFYTAGADVLWITFFEGRLWWAFSDPQVYAAEDATSAVTGSRYRSTVGGWSDKNIAGEVLWKNSLRGSSTTTEGFRGAVCKVREFEYLLRRLNNEETDQTKAVREARANLVAQLSPLVAGLHWKDFELLVELVITQGGWRRVSATGGVQHTTDLEVELPLTGERALVQVKSRIDNRIAKQALEKLVAEAGGSRIFLVYHTQDETLSLSQENVTLIGPESLAEKVVDAGLSTWVMNKVG